MSRISSGQGHKASIRPEYGWRLIMIRQFTEVPIGQVFFTSLLLVLAAVLFCQPAFGDQIVILRDGPFITGSDSNSVAIVLDNPEPRQALQVTVTYDHQLLVFHGAMSEGRLLPSIETVSADDGAGVVRVLVFDKDATGLAVDPGLGQVVDLRFTPVISAVPATETTIGATAALAASDDSPPILVESIAFTPATISIVTSVDEGTVHIPRRSMLFQNAPNPFNPITKIRFDVGRKDLVKIRVYDLAGRLVCRLFNEVLEPGSHTVKWSGRDDNDHRMASGVYFYRLDVGTYSSVKKMTLLK